MTDTINDVPRELTIERDVFGAMHIKLGDFDFIQIQYQYPYTDNASTKALAERIADLLSAPSPAGVDGLKRYEVFPYLDDEVAELDICESDDGTFVKYDNAQAIIDGLRGEVADLRSMLATVSKAGLRVRTERDQHAKRIGELETALEFACKSLAQVTSSDGSGHADIAVSVLRMAGTKDADALHVVEAYKAGAKWLIDAALSAGKEGE